MRRILTPSLLACLVVAGGCANRGADDRVTVDETARAVNHGPGYTVVALRHSDRARLSNGAVIINPAGEEPVYVLDAGYTRAPLPAVKTNQQETAELLDRVDALLAALPPAPPVSPAGTAAAAAPIAHDPRPASPPPAAAPAPATPAAPAPAPAAAGPAAPPEAPQPLQAAPGPSQGPSGASEAVPALGATAAPPAASASLGDDPAGEAATPAGQAPPTTYPWRELHKDQPRHPVPASRAP